MNVIEIVDAVCCLFLYLIGKENDHVHNHVHGQGSGSIGKVYQQFEGQKGTQAGRAMDTTHSMRPKREKYEGTSKRLAKNWGGVHLTLWHLGFLQGQRRQWSAVIKIHSSLNNMRRSIRDLFN